MKKSLICFCVIAGLFQVNGTICAQDSAIKQQSNVVRPRFDMFLERAKKIHGKRFSDLFAMMEEGADDLNEQDMVKALKIFQHPVFMMRLEQVRRKHVDEKISFKVLLQQANIIA